MERVQVPETLIHQVKHFWIQSKSLLILLHEPQHWTASVVGHQLSELLIVLFLHGSHLVDGKWVGQSLQELLILAIHLQGHLLHLHLLVDVGVHELLHNLVVEDLAGNLTHSILVCVSLGSLLSGCLGRGTSRLVRCLTLGAGVVARAQTLGRL